MLSGGIERDPRHMKWVEHANSVPRGTVFTREDAIENRIYIFSNDDLVVSRNI